MRTRQEIEEIVKRAISVTSHSELVMIELLLDIRDLLQPQQKLNKHGPAVNEIFQAYVTYIKPTAILTDISVKKIEARLKKFDVATIIQAIMKFSKNDWWMKHKGHEGMKWFFRDDDQIERFKDLKQLQEKGETEWI